VPGFGGGGEITHETRDIGREALFVKLGALTL
jgi:hypothetical protein